MNIEIGPGRAGDPVLYIDNYPVEEVFDVDRMNALIQRLEITQKALTRLYLACPPPATSKFEEESEREEYVESIVEAMEVSTEFIHGDEIT